ncbi:MAG: hypothetical protein JXQ29_18630 [Planctomycetes bacterium]|nr:hypothetical protein [Planctomycetota bacterium]
MAARAPGYGLRDVILTHAEEDPEGTWEEPVADYGTVLYAADHRSEWESFKNQPLNPSLTPRQTTLGGLNHRITWESELGGRAGAAPAVLATGVPQWAKSAAGMQSEQGKSWDLTTDTGTPIPGERFLEATGAHGFYFFKIIGTPGNADQVIGVEIGTVAISTAYTGEKSGATFTTSDTLNAANYCVIHRPISQYDSRSYGLCFKEPGTVSTYIRVAVAGARGTWGIRAARGQTIRLLCEVLGAFNAAESSSNVTITDAEIIGDPYTQLGFIGDAIFTAFGVDAAYTQLSNFELALGNPLAMRESANVAAGVIGVRHGPGGREPTGSIDPEMAANVTDTETWSAFVGTEGILAVNLGSVAGNIAEIRVGRALFTGYSGGDRGPIKVLALPFDVAGAGTAKDYEIMIATR